MWASSPKTCHCFTSSISYFKLAFFTASFAATILEEAAEYGIVSTIRHFKQKFSYQKVVCVPGGTITTKKLANR